MRAMFVNRSAYSGSISVLLILLKQVAQGGCGCPITGGIQGQARYGSGQPGLVVGGPAHSRGAENR